MRCCPPHLEGQCSVASECEYYIINVRGNYIGKDIDPEAYARKLGVLKEWEVVRDI